MTDIPTEEKSRRPDWSEGYWVTLADGQWWSFPVLEMSLGTGLPRDRVWKVGGIPDSETGKAFEGSGESIVSIASLLLRRNYAVDEQQALWLLKDGFFREGVPSPLYAQACVKIFDHVITPIRNTSREAGREAAREDAQFN